MFAITIEAGIEPFTNSLNFASSFDQIMSGNFSKYWKRPERDFLILEIIILHIVEARLSNGWHDDLWIEQSGLELRQDSFRCVLGQDTWLLEANDKFNAEW